MIVMEVYISAWMIAYMKQQINLCANIALLNANVKNFAKEIQLVRTVSDIVGIVKLKCARNVGCIAKSVKN